MSPIWQSLLPAALAVLSLALTGAAALGANYLAKRAATSKTFAVLASFWEVVRSTVAHADVELRPALTAALADGRLSPEEGKALKEAAIKLVRAQLGTGGLAALQNVLKVELPGLETYISGAIERALYEQKAAVVVGAPVNGPGAPLVSPGLSTPR